MKTLFTLIAVGVLILIGLECVEKVISIGQVRSSNFGYVTLPK